MSYSTAKKEAVGKIVITLGVILILAAIGFFFAAVWSTGPIAGHLGGTGAILSITGALACVIGGVTYADGW